MADNTPDGIGFADEPRQDRPAESAGNRPGPKKKGSKGRDPYASRSRKSSAGKPVPAENKSATLWGILLLVLFIGIAAFMAVYQSRQRAAEQTAFAAEMDKLIARPAAGPVKATPGKVAIIDVNKRELHYLHDPNGGHGTDVPAATPQEAVTIVQLRVTDRVVYEYLGGRKGVKQTFHLTVIDKATWKKIDERSFEGGDPPESIRLKSSGAANEPVAGPLPSQEIRAYLRGLCGG